MFRRVRELVAVTAVAGFGLPMATAGLYNEVWQALEIVATPIGAPLIPTADGTRVNGQRQGRLRIVPNRLGNGHRLEFDRVYGLDSRGRPEVFDAGAFELELAGATQMTLGYTDRRFPVVDGEFIANNLNYRAAVKTGAIDATVLGQLNVANSVEINPLGFYTMQVNVTNDNSEIRFDSINDQDSEELDFDVGPVTVRGNVFYDMFVGLLGSLGVDTTELEALTPKSPIDQIVDSVQASFIEAAVVAGYSVSIDEEDAFVLTPLDEDASLEKLGGDTAATGVASEQAIVPEPTTVVLLLAGLALVRRR